MQLISELFFNCQDTEYDTVELYEGLTYTFLLTLKNQLPERGTVKMH